MLLAKFNRDRLLPDPDTGVTGAAREEKLRKEGAPYLSNRGYLNRIKQAKLDIVYGGFICESYGAFGQEAWDFITKVSKRDAVGGHGEFGYSPWGRPEWKRHCMLAVGFAIQRGNAAMFVRSDVRRRSHTRKFCASGPTSHRLGGG